MHKLWVLLEALILIDIVFIVFIVIIGLIQVYI
jgi:hypothetical protein